MRNISAGSLAKLAENFATEPVNIIEIQWQVDGNYIAYADDTDLSLQLNTGIMELGDLDAVLQLEGGTVQEISVSLDDTDGTLKEIINNNDIHKRPVRVYQWFKGLPLSDKFLLFHGQINSPIVWKEADRTLSFSVVSKLEDKEIGFSPEEGQFDNLPWHLIGKPWPMCFGTVLDVPAVQVTEEPNGQLMEGLGFHDFTIQPQITAIRQVAASLDGLALYYGLAAGVAAFNGDEELEQQLEAQAAQFAVQAVQTASQVPPLLETYFEQVATEKDSIRILNGNKFPQGTTLTLAFEATRSGNPNAVAKITGSFSGDIFTISKRIHPERANFPPKVWPAALFLSWDGPVTGASGSIATGEIIGDSAGFFWADAGSRVYIDGHRPVEFVASIVPGTVLKVSAKRAVEGAEELFTVPESYYTVFTRNYGTIDAVIISLNRPLTSYFGEGWADEIYFSFVSDIGPNTVDILEYLIDLYTEYPVNTDSFNYVRDKVENYPSNFALLTRKNLIDTLQEISMRARCALWLTDEFNIRYLPEEPDTVGTITESDIVPAQSLELHHTPTEDLVTKLTALWRESYAAEEPNKIILRHNVKKYGIQEREIDWYIYNNQELVLKSATFWLIRWANTWKRLKFSTPIKHLALETLDGVTLDFTQNYIANGPILGQIEEAKYNSADRAIDFSVWTPVKAGTMVAYDFAFPAAVDPEFQFPTVPEVIAGNAGGDGIGAGARGQSSQGAGGVGDLGQDNDLFDRGYSDKGDKFPSDVNDVAPAPPGGVMNAPIDTGKPQGLDTPEYIQGSVDQSGSAPSTINLDSTMVFDPVSRQRAPFRTAFAKILDSVLHLDTNIKVTDGENDSTFDFLYSEEYGKFGAGTAFLKDE